MLKRRSTEITTETEDTNRISVLLMLVASHNFQ